MKTEKMSIREQKQRKAVRLYRFYNFNVGKSGEPIAICDFHILTQKIPPACVLNKIADKANEQCNRCAYERD